MKVQVRDERERETDGRGVYIEKGGGGGGTRQIDGERRGTE